MDKKCVSSQVVLLQVNCFLRKRMVIREGDSKIRVSPNPQMGESLFIVFPLRHWVSWGLPGESAEGAIPQEISTREVFAGLEGSSRPAEFSLRSASRPTPHAPRPQPLCRRGAHFRAARSLPRLRSLPGTAGDLPPTPAGCPGAAPTPPALHRGSRTPSTLGP